MQIKQLTPTLMTGSLLLGLLVALAHHFYYLYLDMRIVKSQSQQQWYLRAGTGLAFLVRAFLSAAVSTAYTQVLWRTLRSRPITIRGVNSLFDVIHNPFEFFTWDLWSAAPLLAVVAVVAWALPLVAVITPATLTVTVSSTANITTLHMPIPIPDYAKVDTFGGWAGKIIVPSTYVSRLLLSVASQGSILAIPAPFPNSSYALNFHGPTLSCKVTTNKTFSTQINKAIQDSDGSIFAKKVFVGFVPNGGPGVGFGVEECALAGLEYVLNTAKVATTSYLDYTARGPKSAAKVYVAVPNGLNSNPDIYGAMKIIECQLYNSSFTANFTFNNGQQDIHYNSTQLNKVTVSNDFEADDMNRKYQGATDAYASLMDAMGQLLLGSLSKVLTSSSTVSIQTWIRSSSLMDTKEMYGLEKGGSGSMIGNISMSDALEDLFANLTISLFSHSQFLQAKSAASRILVNHSTTQNEFSYEPRNLLAAYGVGLLLAWLIVIVGLLCIKSASASYRSSFSTILRTTRNPDIDNIIPITESTGAEPLSKHLSNVRLVLQRQEGGPESGDDEKATFFTVDSKSHEMNTDQTQDSAESLLQQDTPMVHTSTSVESSIVYDEALWERNGDLSLRIFNYRQDTRGD
ncbi:hypothetical protein FPSE_07541 [Fusarium pseudograminearum CS3096]|uniref:Uncharacterized protein n=1 Tax=Fusarium pseudograminearum (strain CS3096) TaxID=1028729 RepID=K3VDZ9_FUSPC|nr:hypothetical protein FPSE_07541 [Fusarium pseudograminearum CS3096]EKJ72312.1 hypothetical protein FPSE_07541 [Fusarium pseudograminearum CS3096]